MRTSFVVIGLCLFALSFSHASSESKTEGQPSEIKGQKTFLPPHEPIFKKPYFKHIPVPVYKPKPHPIPVYKPKPYPIPVYKPKPHPIPVYKPKPHPIPVFKPKPVPVPIYKPKPVHVPVPVYIPKPTPVSVPIYKPHPHPYFKKPTLTPYFSHPKKPCPPNTP